MNDSKSWEAARRASRRVAKANKVYKVKTDGQVYQYRKPSDIAGATEVKARIKEIGRTIKALKTERVELKKRLKPWIIEYEKIPYQLYALELESGCWYVGMSRNPQRRFKRHGTPKGARWTELHKPTRIHETRATNILVESEAGKLENDMTLEYALKYGSEVVRGGGYCQRKPVWPDVIIQNELHQ